MARPDLLALTTDGLAQLANVGLVKRGLRDLDAGLAPTLAEEADGTVEARFADGTLTRLSAGRVPNEATCSCPASGMCRHRVLLVLAYRRQAERAEEAAPAAWDPATLDLDACEAALPAAARAELGRLLGARLAVGLERGAVPAARLPMATVRFLVPGDLAYARCDCVATGGCAHVALALRAFRAAAGGTEATLGEVIQDRGDAGLAEAIDAVLAGLLAEGVVAGTAAHAAALARATDAARARGATQLHLTLDDLADQIVAYEERSARHDEEAVLLAAAELFARTRAVDPAAALGLGETFETAMAKTRLVSLGARLAAQGEDVRASVLLADTDTGTVVSLERRFGPGTARPAGSGLRPMAPGLDLDGLGRGQLLTSVARRRADGLLTLGRGERGKTVLMPRAALQAFPPPLAAGRVETVLASLGDRPVSLVRRRSRAGEVHVFPVASVLGQAWAPGDQIWRAAVTLPDEGGTLHLERSFDAAAPGALDALSAALEGRNGPVRQVAGTVRADSGALVCTPWALTCDRFIVPDLETAASADLPLALDAGSCTTPLDRAMRLLAGALHGGRRGRDRASEKALLEQLERTGHAATARRLRSWVEADTADPRRFGAAAAWLFALREG